MGLFEDDRIRAKNSVHNAAWTIYTTLVNSGDSPALIHERMSLLSNADDFRDDIRREIVRLAKGALDAESVPNSARDSD